jgi:hypothetical protein
MNVGILGLTVGLLVGVAGLVLIFATGGVGIPIGVVLILAVLAAGAVRSRPGASQGPPGTDPRHAGPGRPLRNDRDSTVFVGTGEPSDPLAGDRR